MPAVGPTTNHSPPAPSRATAPTMPRSKTSGTVEPAIAAAFDPEPARRPATSRSPVVRDTAPPRSTTRTVLNASARTSAVAIGAITQIHSPRWGPSRAGRVVLRGKRGHVHQAERLVLIVVHAPEVHPTDRERQRHRQQHGEPPRHRQSRDPGRDRVGREPVGDRDHGQPCDNGRDTRRRQSELTAEKHSYETASVHVHLRAHVCGVLPDGLRARAEWRVRTRMTTPA